MHHNHLHGSGADGAEGTDNAYREKTLDTL